LRSNAVDEVMDWKHKLLLGGIALGLVAGVLAFRSWLSEHDLRLKAEESSKAQVAVQAEVKNQLADLQKQMTDRDAAYQSQLKSLGNRFSGAATDDQLAQLVSQLLAVRNPIKVVTPAATPENPHPTPVAQIPVADAPQVKAYFSECEECKASRAKLQADAADRIAQMELAQKEMDSLKTERDTWKTAAKGGTKWQRMGRAAKWIGVGVVVGLAASQARR
jgi:FtsZ-binding cell division protein ZapB